MWAVGRIEEECENIETFHFHSNSLHNANSNSRNIADAVELAELVRAKYGKYHDIAILRNTGQIAFNIYGPHLSQRAFPYTEEQYMQKLSTIVLMLNDFDQAWYVKQVGGGYGRRNHSGGTTHLKNLKASHASSAHQMLNALTSLSPQFLLSPIVPRNGLPSTPRFDTAVTLRLNLSPTWKNVPKSIVDGWFAFSE